MGKIKDFFKNYKTRKQLKAEIEELKKIPIIIPPIMRVERKVQVLQ